MCFYKPYLYSIRFNLHIFLTLFNIPFVLYIIHKILIFIYKYNYFLSISGWINSFFSTFYDRLLNFHMIFIGIFMRECL